MRHRCRGVTITELLTVVALVTILTSFLGPVVTTVKHAAIARSCSNNLRQCYTTIQICANASSGKFMPCFELDTTDSPLQIKDYAIKESSWWYRKVFAKLYPTKSIDADSPAVGAGLDIRTTYVHPQYNALRCPASLDPYDENRVYPTRRVYNWYCRVGVADKDRVFDDNYGYNNFGFKYAGPAGTDRSSQSSIPDPALGMPWGCVGNGAYYHTSYKCATHGLVFPWDYAGQSAAKCPVCKGNLTYDQAWGSIYGRPTHLRHAQNPNDATKCLCGAASGSCAKANRCDCDVDYPEPYRKIWPCPYTRLGEFAVVPEPGRTMLMMDYVKADVAPNITNDFLRGYRFRHGGRGNTLFVDGHVDLMSGQDFRRDWAEPDHGEVAYAKDPVTKRARIHWAVLRPNR